MRSLTRLAETWARVRPLEGQRRALIVLLLGLVGTSVAFFAVRRGEADERRVDFQRRSAELSFALRANLERPLETLRLLPALFNGSDPVDRDEFMGMVSPTLARYPGVAYLEWAPEVLDEQRESFEDRARELGFAGFFIGQPGAGGALVPAPRRPQYLPLLYVAPPSSAVVGLDLGFEPGRRELALRALADGVTQVSPQFHLIEDPPHVRSVAVYAPLTHPRRPSSEPHGARRGVAVLIFRIEPLMRAVIGDKLHEIDLALLDESGPHAPELLFESRPGLATRNPGHFEAAHTLSFAFHSRSWTLRSFAKPDSLPQRMLSPLIASFGVVLSIALMLLVGIGDLARRLRSEVQAAQQIGQYRLIRRLGEGAMGIVYEAEHALLRRPTAIKVISPHAVGQDAIERFEREVKATSQLTHPNTVAVYDYGRAPRGVFYYAMEYLQGANLEQLVRTTGVLPPQRVTHLLRQICGSLAEAHERGLVHRDIKPANVMVCERGGIADFVKVLDFGLVKDVRQAPEHGASLGGAIVGTPHYMAPEILRGRGASPASDLYALGAVGYFMLTGSELFPERTMLGVIAHHVSEPPPPPSERLGRPLPPSLERVIMRCLAKTAEQRPASASELDDLLAACELPVWTQAEAKEFWMQHREQLRISLEAAASSETPRLDTLVVDLQNRVVPFHSSGDLASELDPPAARDQG